MLEVMRAARALSQQLFVPHHGPVRSSQLMSAQKAPLVGGAFGLLTAPFDLPQFSLNVGC